MTIKELYNKFYVKVRYAKKDSERRHYKNLKTRIEELDISKCENDIQKQINCLEEEISQITSTKYSCVYSFYKFIDFLKENDHTIETSLSKNYETQTRRMELIRFLQTPKTREQILDEFLIKRRTLDEDFAALEKGIEFCGTKLKVKLSRYDRKGRRTVDGDNYTCTCHPIGLALNLTELFLLTEIIPNQIKNEEIKRRYKDLLHKIYPQLSDYAKKILKLENYLGLNMYEIESEQLEKDAIQQLIYYLKREKRCTVVYQKNGERLCASGFVCLNVEDGFSIRDGKKEIIIEFKDFVGVVDFKKDYE